MLKKLLSIATLISIFSFANCTENKSNSQIRSRLKALGVILEDQDDSALDLSEQRIYVDPEKISISEQGLILYTKGEKRIALPELFSCSNGCFVKCNESDLELLAENDDLRIWWCSRCNAFRKMDNYGCCRICGGKL